MSKTALGQRLTRVPWKDPRLAAGVLLVLGGGLAGGLILSGDDTVPVLRAKSTIAEGTALTTGDFVVVDVPASVAGPHVRAASLPSDVVAAHSIADGELLSPSDLAAAESAKKVDLAIPLTVTPASGLRPGATVELWRVSVEAPGGKEAAATVLAKEAVLLDVERGDGMFAGDVTAQVRVDPDDVESILAVLGTKDGFAIVDGDGR